jgi:hypothetical protein
MGASQDLHQQLFSSLRPVDHLVDPIDNSQKGQTWRFLLLGVFHLLDSEWCRIEIIVLYLFHPILLHQILLWR